MDNFFKQFTPNEGLTIVIGLATVIVLYLHLRAFKHHGEMMRLQSQALEKQMEAASYTASVSHLVPISMYFLENPGLYRYFYENVDPPDPETDEGRRVLLLAMMSLDLFGHLLDETRNYPAADRRTKALLAWIHLMGKKSPVIRSYYSANKELYHEKLAAILDAS